MREVAIRIRRELMVELASPVLLRILLAPGTVFKGALVYNDPRCGFPTSHTVRVPDRLEEALYRYFAKGAADEALRALQKDPDA